ncbi:MAG: Mur ligase family protein, partial [Chloroflexota bacterium]
MDYDAAIAYLLSFADFERTGRFQERPDVAPMLALLHRLGDPHLGRRTVHVAGSKGKGSVSAMIESILRAAGQRTGLYTSPHLHDYTERVRIDGAPISREDFARIVTEMRPAVETEQASGNDKIVTFDLLTALAFMAFRECGVDTQVIEVGLGGRVDQTNVFESKEVAVITPLSYEHTAVLGDRIEQIAAEKAAIITPGCTAVLAPQPYPQAAAVVRDFAAN